MTLGRISDRALRRYVHSGIASPIAEASRDTKRLLEVEYSSLTIQHLEKGLLMPSNLNVSGVYLVYDVSGLLDC